MDLKSFLWPNKKKVLFSLLFFGFSALIHLFPWLSVGFMVDMLFEIMLLINALFYGGAILFYSAPIYYSIAIFLFLAYPFSCYLVGKNWSLIRGAVYYLPLYMIFTIVAYSAINVYNGAVGHSCVADTDCSFVCGGGYTNGGNINSQYLLLKEPFAIVDCEYRQPICEQNKCSSFAIYRVNSSEYCERVTYEGGKDQCYDYLARNMKDANFCNKITDELNKEYCLDQFK